MGAAAATPLASGGAPSTSRSADQVTDFVHELINCAIFTKCRNRL